MIELYMTEAALHSCYIAIYTVYLDALVSYNHGAL